VTYFDTSALIKLYVKEPGSEAVSTLVTETGSVATAKVAFVEVHAGLARRRRAGDLSVAGHARTCRQFEEQWRTYVRLDLRDDILVQARELVQRHPLRSLDAIHLASALALRAALGQEVRFVAADGRLVKAAGLERFTAVNVGPTASS
jgi:predicted nucleic acid-binding protein